MLLVLFIALRSDTVPLISPYSCFISNLYVFFGAFLGPIFAVVLFNFAIFVLVVSVLIRHTKRKMTDNTNKTSKRKSTFRALLSIVGVMSLFGLTWVFGAFTFREASIVFQYAFAICNSFQGFFIFLIFCVLAKDTRNLWLQALRCKKAAPRGIPSTAAMMTKGAASSSNSKLSTSSAGLARSRDAEWQSVSTD